MFCRKLSRSISIDSCYCNRFIDLGRPIFSLNHSSVSAATLFTIPTTFGIAHARCCSRWTGHPICNPSRIITTWWCWCSYCSVNPLRPKNCIYHESYLSCLYKLNCNLLNHHETFFFPASATSNPPFLLVGCDSWWLRNDLSIPRAPENMLHKNIITIYSHIWT